MVRGEGQRNSSTDQRRVAWSKRHVSRVADIARAGHRGLGWSFHSWGKWNRFGIPRNSHRRSAWSSFRHLGRDSLHGLAYILVQAGELMDDFALFVQNGNEIRMGELATGFTLELHAEQGGEFE